MAPKFEDSSRLPKQFVIFRQIPEAYSSWKTRRLNDWTVAASAEVPIVALCAVDGVPSGYLIGWAINDGALLADGTDLYLEPDKQAAFYDRLCGRYILLYRNDGATYARTDAGGLLPLVYCPQSNTAASTPTALLPWQSLEINSPVSKAFNIPPRHGWYPFGLTPFVGVTRLLPNHSLCLESWQTERFWPRPQDIDAMAPAAADAEKIAIEIAKKTQKNVAAIIAAGRGIAHLTAGFDSRMVVAATKPYLADCTFETVQAPNNGKSLDSDMAAMISAKLGLRHEFIEFIETPPAEIDAWLTRTGYCVYDHVTSLAATAERYDRQYHALTGTCGEVGRAYYWGDGIEKSPVVSVETLLLRLGIPETEETIAAANQWTQGLPVQGGSLFWDLAYIEQRLGCWAGPSVFGHNVSFPSLSPFNCHEIYRLMLSLPEEYRASQQFSRDFIDYLWPELLDFPFNRAVGLSKLKYMRSEIPAILPDRLVSILKRIRKKLKS